MQWTRSETIALAKPGCAQCLGLGLLLGRSYPCGCVLREIFRIVLRRYREAQSFGPLVSRSTLREAGRRGGKQHVAFGRGYYRNEEFIADFELVSRRRLGGPASLRYRIFYYHFLLGADWQLCCRKLNLDRGSFFHEVYRIEAMLGRAYRETKPYALFPLDEYFTDPARTRADQRPVPRPRELPTGQGNSRSFLLAKAA